MRNNYKMDLTVFNNYEMTFSSTTESGLPYIYTMEVPTLLKLEAELKKGTESSRKQHTGILNTLLANKVQQRIGFLASFEHQHYLTGVDKNQLLQIPAEFEVKLDMSKQNLALKIRPSSSQTDSTSQLRLLQYNTIPFTTRQDLLELQPVSLDKNTQQVLNSKKQKIMLQQNAFSLRLETDNKEIMQKDQKDLQLRDYLKLLKLQEPNGNYKKLELLLNTEVIGSESLSLNVDYDSLKVNTANEEYLSGSSESRERTVFAEVDWKPNNKERRELFLKDLSKSVRSGDVHVMDLSYRLPMTQQLQVLTVGAVSSDLDKKSKAYVYWNTQSLSSQEPNYEIGYYQEIQYSPDTPLNFEYALQHAPRDEFKAQLRYGKSLKSATKIVAVGSATRSNYLKEIIENSKTAKQCRQEISEGNKALLSCQKATEIAQVRDQYDLSLKAPKSVQETINEALDYVSKYVPGSHIESSYPKNPKSDTVNVKLTMLPGDVLSTKLYLSTSQRDVTYRYPWERMWNRQQLQRQTNSLLESKVERGELRNFVKKIIIFEI